MAIIAGYHHLLGMHSKLGVSRLLVTASLGVWPRFGSSGRRSG